MRAQRVKRASPLRAAVVALALVAAGCGAGKSRLDLTVRAGGTISGIDHLRIFVITAEGQKSHEADAHVGGSIPPAQAVALRLPPSVRGKTTITVDAMGTGAAPLASISGTVTITPSNVATLTLTLPGGVTNPDMMPMFGPPAQLAFTAQPSDSAIGQAIKPAVAVSVEDANGNVVTNATTAITLALADNPTHAVLGGTLTVMAVDGVASFPDLTLDADGSGYTLGASAAMLASATSMPFNIRAPVWTQATNGIFGGVVSCVAAAGNPLVLYAATHDSGVFVSTNGGARWSGIPNGLPQVPIDWLAVDPTDAMRVFAATDDGVYVTSNGGSAWTKAYDPAPNTQFPAVAIDPAAPMHVFAAGGGKIVKSVDGGMTWNDDSTGIGTGSIFSLAVGATGVLATVFNEAMSGGGVWRQPNAGGTWTKDSGWPNSMAFTGSYPRQVATDAAGGVALAVSDAGNFITKTGAAGWAQLTTAGPNNLQAPNGLSAAVDPADSTHQFVGGVGAACAGCAGVWYSTDNGGTWNAFGGMLGNFSATAIAVDHAGMQIFAATNVGVFKQPMTGGTSAPANAGLTALPIASLAANGSVFAGTTLASVFKTSDGGMNWGPSSGSGGTAIAGTMGKVSALVFDPTSAMVVYAGQSTTGVWKSADGGATWSNVGNNGSGLTDLTVGTIAVAPANPMLVYASTSVNGLFKSTNGGTSWASANLSGMTLGPVVFDPTSSNTLYAAFGTSISKTSDGAVSWMAMGMNLPAAAYTGLCIDGGSASTLYAGSSAGAIFKSIDGAATWSPSGTLAAGALRMLAAHPSKPGIVYAATNAGVFRTVDGGANWAAFNVGLGNIDVTTIAFDRADPTVLYVGTGGGGVYKATP